VNYLLGCHRDFISSPSYAWQFYSCRRSWKTTTSSIPTKILADSVIATPRQFLRMVQPTRKRGWIRTDGSTRLDIHFYISPLIITMIYFGRGPQRIEAFSLLSMHTSYYHIIISECDVGRPLTDWGTTLLFKSAIQRAITQCQDNSIRLLKTDDSFAFWTCHSFCVCSTALLSLLTHHHRLFISTSYIISL
jgi:hypothetical protein